jgi:choice-of-anchor B domain-containing protein
MVCPGSAWRYGSALALLLASSWCAAHEDEHVRYLSPGGVDTGGCQTPATACRSVGYTAGQAGKGGEVKVAAGQYTLAGREDLFYVWSETAELSGGYSADFHAREPDQHPSVLIGVPPERRAALEARGFQVVVDSKWSESEEGIGVAEALAPMLESSGPVDCIDGRAGIHACEHIDLLSHMALPDFSTRPSGANDIWGFVDLNTEREYALVGLRNGVAVVDVSDPAAPFEVGSVSGQQTGWRDIKVLQYFDDEAARWQAYAYVTADAASDFLTIIDLTGLPHEIRLATRATADRSAHNLNITGVDPTLNIALPGRPPILYLAGSNVDAGAFRAFDLGNTIAPALVSRSLNGYMHDGTGTVLRDPAQIAGCPAGGPSCEVLADFNEDRLQLWDVTAADAPQLLSVLSHATATYVHSGSWSEDGRYLFMHDELDERDRGLDTQLYVVDAADLGTPVITGTWTGPNQAIDHNGYPRGNRYYISNYTRGLTVLDLTEPAAPVTVGHFDTFPLSDNPVFSGAWGVYPYMPSRVLLVSDIESGLFVLRDGTLTSAAGAISFGRSRMGVRSGETARIPLQRRAGASGAVSVGWEVLPGSLGAAEDAVTSGRIHWPDGDTQAREIELPVAALAADGPEIGRLFLRLFDPRGGAVLGDAALASVFVDQPGALARLDFQDPPALQERSGRALLIVERRGSTSGPASVNFATRAGSATEGDDYLAAGGTLAWEDGDGTARVIELAIIADQVAEEAEQFFVDFSNPLGAAVERASAVITIAASPGPPPPPPAPVSSGGGGAAGLPALLAMCLLCLTGRGRSRYTRLPLWSP